MAKDDEYFRWRNSELKKVDAEIVKEARTMEKQITADAVEEAKRRFAEQAKIFEREQQQMIAITTAIMRAQARRGGTFQIVDVAAVAQAIVIMNKLGLTIQDVDKHFGSATRDAQQLLTRMKQLDQEAGVSRSAFGGLQQQMEAYAESMRNSQTDAERWSGFLENAINQMGSNIEQGFEGLVNGTTTFAQLMKKIVFDLIASLAEQWGSYYLAMGIADIWSNPAKGGAELAAGAALMALAGVLHALGGAGSHTAAAASAGAGGGASSAAAGSGGGAPSPTPRVISFATSGQPQRMGDVHIHLDGTSTAQTVSELLVKKGHVTVSSAKQQHRGQLKRALGS